MNHKHCHTHDWEYCSHCQIYYCSVEGCDEERSSLPDWTYYPQPWYPQPWTPQPWQPYPYVTWPPNTTYPTTWETTSGSDSVTSCSHV